MAGTGHGPEAVPARGRDFAEFVRYTLQAAADQVEPRADALVPIRARILAGSGIPWPQAFAISLNWIHDA